MIVVVVGAGGKTGISCSVPGIQLCLRIEYPGALRPLECSAVILESTPLRVIEKVDGSAERAGEEH